MNRRRLDVEAWRDALLAVSGNLDPTLGGPSFDLDGRRTPSGARSTRKVSRHDLDGLLRLFDFPDPNITSDRRDRDDGPAAAAVRAQQRVHGRARRRRSRPA